MRRCSRMIASLLPTAERASPGVTRSLPCRRVRFTSARTFCIMAIMSAKPKKRGRPATGVDQLYGVRIPDSLVLAVDRWAAENDSPSRSDAMRRLLELSFSKKPPKVKH